MAISPDGPGKGRVAIVTSGSRGVGRETVERLASLGCAVAVNYVHDQRTAESTVDAVLEGRGAAVAIRADVCDVLDVERLFDQTIEAFGGVDAVVHAVPDHVSPTPLSEVAFDDFDEMCRTNLRATFIVNRMAARRLRNGGAIVNLFSSVPPPALPAFGGCATTTAVAEALTRLLALELGEREITVNALSLAVDKACVPSRVAEVVTYLLGNEGHAITGHVIHLVERRERHLELRLDSGDLSKPAAGGLASAVSEDQWSPPGTSGSHRREAEPSGADSTPQAGDLPR